MLGYNFKIRLKDLKKLELDYAIMIMLYMNEIKNDYRNMLYANIIEYFEIYDKNVKIKKKLKKFYNVGASFIPILTSFLLASNLVKDVFVLKGNEEEVLKIKDELKKVVSSVDYFVNRRGELCLGIDMRNRVMYSKAVKLETGGGILFYPKLFSKTNKQFSKYIEKYLRRILYK